MDQDAHQLTLNGGPKGLRELPPKSTENSGLGIIVICLDPTDFEVVDLHRSHTILTIGPIRSSKQKNLQ